MATMIINGRRVNVSGNNVSIVNNQVTVDGKRVDLDEDTKVFNIVIEGNVTSLDGEFAKVTVNGDVGSVKTMSGDVKVAGDVTGNVSTMSGDIKTKGGVRGKASSMSGDITR